MKEKYKSNATILLLLTVFLAMNLDTYGQRKRSRPAATPTPAVKQSLPEISYIVSMSKPWTHLLEVEMRVKWDQMPDKTELKMPVWTPGSYLVREYARHVQGFGARDSSGAELTWSKTNKNTWQIDTRGVSEIIVAYKVYSNELTVRTNELNDEHAFWNNTALLLFVKDQLGASSTLKVDPYGNWRVATGLPAVAGQTNVFRSENYDILYDSPFEVSDFKEFSFDVLGKKHRIVITGEGNYDLQRLAADTTKIIEACYKIFGAIDYEDYTIIVNLRGGGGLEHLNSTALQTNRFAFSSDTRYKAFLGLVAHEYFHVYNVKRIRPDVLGPFDYENENYTRLLWVAEGTTEYYASLLLLRAGLITEGEFLRGKALAIQQLQTRPGRFETSLEEASFDAWIKFYRQDENAINNQISYYDKGEIVNMMLDITIRSASGGVKSLDDVMLYLHDEFYKKDKNFTSEDFQKAAELIAGKSLNDFFSNYVRGKTEIDYDSIVGSVGLKMTSRQENLGNAYIGANLAEENGRLIIRSIPAGTPAYEQGLNTSDQIVAVDGYRASQSFLQSYINERKPGDTVKLSIFRFDKMREIDFKLGSDTRKEYSLVPMPDASDEQKRLYNQYLGGGK